MNEQAVVSDEYKVDLPVFAGPLDLLLYLIKKEEVDVYAIPIAKITKQYLKYIEIMTNLNLEVAGEFILMAATLIRIKTRLLLPREEVDGEEVDPREELIMALMEYKKYREAGEILKERALLEEQNYVPPSPVQLPETKIDLQPGTSLYDLMSAFQEVLRARRDEAFHNVVGEETSIEERIETIIAYLRHKEWATFVELFADVPRKIVAVVTFIALLEMCRAKRVSIRQSKVFGELRVYRGDRYDAPTNEVDLITIDGRKHEAKI